MPSISSGSRIVSHGAVPGPNTPFFSPVAWSMSTDTLADSAPDPAVVGTEPIPVDTRLDGALAAARLGVEADEGPGRSAARSWTARLLTMPFGDWMVMLAGLSVIGFGLYQIFKGYKAKFRKRLKLPEIEEGARDWALLSGRIGYAARGVVFCIIGFFVIQAARHLNPDEAKGLDEALQTLAENYYGAWALGVVAVGLIAYGFYMLVEARYRQI